MQSNKLCVGKVKMINYDNGFGFIKSDKFPENIYFKTSGLINTLAKGELVGFEVKNSVKGPIALFVRKIYTNLHGIHFISRPNHRHIHLDMEKYMSSIIDTIDNTDNEFIEKEIYFEEIVGFSECVETNSSDQIFYAIRKGRIGHSRFVKNRNATATNSIFIVLKRIEIGYLIITVYCGERAAREPFDPLATLNDLEFWKIHALVDNEDHILPDTLTNESPWVLNLPSISNINF